MKPRCPTTPRRAARTEPAEEDSPEGMSQPIVRGSPTDGVTRANNALRRNWIFNMNRYVNRLIGLLAISRVTLFRFVFVEAIVTKS